MDWLVAAIIAMGLGVGVAITDKYVVSYFSPRTYTFFVGLVGLLSIFLLPFTTFSSVALWAYGIIIGILFAFVVYTSFVAYQKDEISRFAALNILSAVIITIGAGIFFGERLTTQQHWAFVLFSIGALLLATRIETLVQFEGKGAWKLEELPELAVHTLTDPMRAGRDGAKHIMRAVDRVVIDWVKMARDPSITWVHFIRKLKLIKGLGWYLLSLGLYIPYVLLSKELNSSTGVLAGWVSIRVGLFLGAIIIMRGHWKELRQLHRKRITIIASIKELFGMGTNYLLLFAMTTGIVGVVQSLWAVEAVGVFIVSSVLARWGIIKESLAKKDVVQKGIGVAFVAVATVLLFL